MRSSLWRLRGGPDPCAAGAGARADQRVVGDRFVMALERLMGLGLVLVALSIEMMLHGIKAFIKQVAGA